ncbi:phage tail protein [Caulobacter soli]|uniref:phage tail protein n=1 Tax=Caulobacter soli TaxID=2708539 RepID=UPI0013ECE06D|nr:tail fiber protein [Caulobacter soli]
MSDQFLAEIRIFSFPFAPAGWAQCNGQIMPIQQNTALFSLLGTTYGGNGTSNFGLPNLMGNIPLHVGRNQPGPGLQIYDLGQTGGSTTVTILQTEMAMHSHSPMATTADGTVPTAANNQPARAYTGNIQDYTEGLFYSPITSPQLQMPPQTLGLTGGSQPHNNIMPSLFVNYCIALQGAFPARN